MKKNLIGLLTLVVALSLSSCTKTYYQVCTTKAFNPSLFASVKDGYVYEDENVKITLDMWAENGSYKMLMENKTGRNIYLDWMKSSISANHKTFAVNDMTNTSVQRLSQYLIIPAHKSREFISYDIIDSIFRIEGLKEKVKRSESISFDANESPFTIGYQIAYCFDNQQGEKIVNMDFYVARITNYAEKSFFEGKDIVKIVDGKKKKSRASATTIAPKNGFYVAYIPVNNDIMKRTQLRTAGGQVIYTYTINQ